MRQNALEFLKLASQENDRLQGKHTEGHAKPSGPNGWMT